MMTVDWSAPKCVGWFTYTCDTGHVRLLERYRASGRNHSEYNNRLLYADAVAVVSLWTSTRLEHKQSELQLYRGEYVCDKL